MNVLKSLAKQGGVTLFEALLVLAIGASFLLMGLRFNEELRTEKDIQQIQQNVALLFAGLKGYYFANCIRNRDYNGAFLDTSQGMLDPVATSLPSAKYIDIVTDLKNNGYVSTWPLPNPPIVTNYIVQFNVTYRTKAFSFCYKVPNDPSSVPTCTIVGSQKTENVYILQSQVAVQINNPALVNYYRARLGATCVSDVSGSTVVPCVSSSNTGSYVVFQRLPSSVDLEEMSSLSSGMPGVLQFKRQYTNDDDYSVQADVPADNSATGYEDYICGG